MSERLTYLSVYLGIFKHILFSIFVVKLIMIKVNNKTGKIMKSPIENASPKTSLWKRIMWVAICPFVYFVVYYDVIGFHCHYTSSQKTLFQ